MMSPCIMAASDLAWIARSGRQLTIGLIICFVTFGMYMMVSARGPQP